MRQEISVILMWLMWLDKIFEISPSLSLCLFLKVIRVDSDMGEEKFLGCRASLEIVAIHTSLLSCFVKIEISLDSCATRIETRFFHQLTMLNMSTLKNGIMKVFIIIPLHRASTHSISPSIQNIYTFDVVAAVVFCYHVDISHE